jgi:protocatechuate 3,4-dioxygenase beta subunit
LSNAGQRASALRNEFLSFRTIILGDTAMTTNEKRPTRRELLKLSLTAGATAPMLLGAAVHGAVPTPSQTEGPFYPDIDNDLTFVRRRDQRAMGDVLYVHGVVMDADGKPVSRALVEIWQTDHEGIYDHAGDTRHKDKDPNFQSFGRCVTDDQGRYYFKTIRPRWYGDERFLRTPHIHYKVWRRGYHELTTQLYFKGEERNKDDGLYNELTSDEQMLVTVDFHQVDSMSTDLAAAIKQEFDDAQPVADARVGQFDLVLRTV